MNYGVLLWNKLKIEDLWFGPNVGGAIPNKGMITFTVPFRLERNDVPHIIVIFIKLAIVRKLVKLNWPHNHFDVEVRLPKWNDGIHEAQFTIGELCDKSFTFYHKMFVNRKK